MTQAKKISWDGLHAMVQQHLKRWHIQESELLNMVQMAQIEVSSATIVIDGKNREHGMQLLQQVTMVEALL